MVSELEDKWLRKDDLSEAEEEPEKT